MNTNPLKQGALTENSSGLGTVTRKMGRETVVLHHLSPCIAASFSQKIKFHRIEKGSGYTP